MRRTCLNKVYELARSDKRIIFIGSDLGFETLKEFRAELPRQFMMEGICEANVIGIASGLGLEGKIVYVNTIAPFFTRRAFEQVILDAAMHDVRLRIIGNGAGLVYAPLGPTHLAFEDISTMRAIPGMTIVVPADAVEMANLMPKTVEHPGPIYIRLAKGGDPVITRPDDPFTFGKAFVKREGSDALVVTTGITTQIALQAAETLQTDQISLTVLHMPTIKPIDKEAILARARNIPIIITMEENTIIGGLGSAVAEIVLEANFGSPKKFQRIGIPDVFPDQYGSQQSLLERYRITADELITVIGRFHAA